MRAGKNAAFFEKFMKTSKIYLPWDGYHVDLSDIETITDCKEIVKLEKGIINKTSESNWAGQLLTFVRKMAINDYVLIPSDHSKLYCLAKIIGDYCFDDNEIDQLYHSHKIDILYKGIPGTLFPLEIKYSLGAYRTVFLVKREKDVLRIISEWKNGKSNGNNR